MTAFWVNGMLEISEGQRIVVENKDGAIYVRFIDADKSVLHETGSAALTRDNITVKAV